MLQNLNDSSKDVTCSISQQSRGVNVVHFGDLMVQLDEADGWLSARNGIQAVFHEGADVGLRLLLVVCSTSLHCKGHKPIYTHLRVIHTHHHDRIRGDLFNSIQVTPRIHRLDGPVHLPSGTGTS